MSNTELYIEKFKQLEAVVRSVYNLSENQSISHYLSEQSKFKKYKDEINYCQAVRNLLNHNQKIDGNFAVEVSKSMLDFIDRLIENIKNRKKCRNIQIDIRNVYYKTIEDFVKPTMKTMRERVFTHIPILENGVVVGVFDENSIFNYLADQEIIEIEDNLTFRNIENYISLVGRDMEMFLFFKVDSYVEELEAKFEEAFANGKRIGVAFLTQNGRPNEKLLGIITPWDILAAAKPISK